ncbi:hypothetical protein CsSME_00008001 [Camellia sinensis var. sinensis]
MFKPIWEDGWWNRTRPCHLSSRSRSRSRSRPRLSSSSSLGVILARGTSATMAVEELLVMPFVVSMMMGVGTIALPIPKRVIAPYYLTSKVEQVPRAYVETYYKIVEGLVEMVRRYKSGTCVLS